MKFFWQIAIFFILLNGAWYLTYSNNIWVYGTGFALMGLLMIYSLVIILKVVRKDPPPSHD